MGMEQLRPDGSWLQRRLCDNLPAPMGSSPIVQDSFSLNSFASNAVRKGWQFPPVEPATPIEYQHSDQPLSG